VNVSLIRSMRFDIESDECLVETLNVFRDMVNLMLEYGLENEVYSAIDLEKHFWDTFRDIYGLQTHYITSAARYAAGLFKSYFGQLKAWDELGQQTGEPSSPTQKKLCMRLQTMLAHLELVDGSLELHVVTKPWEHVRLVLQVYQYAEPLVEAWKAKT